MMLKYVLLALAFTCAAFIFSLTMAAMLADDWIDAEDDANDVTYADADSLR